ncbi:sulfate permease [Choiromyces venosus 120613-1]|uniref:Sulfate permease n=1 Tax=Choiromyces venosus 120613-1 TaxID=1336337 RepID=A0A3N4JUU8_9PEZI|nr:sulfate permease [Choiromyces venosus 120613-1]
MSAPVSTKVGHALARVLRIDLNPGQRAKVTPIPGGIEGRDGNDLGTTYIEEEPTVIEWFQQFEPTMPGFITYMLSLIPFVSWIGRYNLKWLYGDLVAGITVGCVVIPQGMAYAKLALLPVEFGLYSSFVGVMIYWFFATSKDITIGPVAVMSTLVGNIVSKAPKNFAYSKEEIASSLALIAGAIVTAMGLLRLGFVVEYIPLTAIAAFMTGSAISIATGQVPAMLGLSGFDTREATYKVFINILKHLGTAKLDAAMGLTALFLLYLIRWVTGSFLPKRFPNHNKTWFFLSTLRTVFTILLYTLISWLVNRRSPKHPLFKILGKVPSGFKHLGIPKANADIFNIFVGHLPATVIVLLIEHIAISKSFGRINNYQINPSQELIAIGITNIFGPFFGGYPATGSFSRTAIKSKAGVRTPFAGVITGIVVLLAIYLLTSVFFYIPNSSLSAVIIHAVGDLITPPNTVYKFWCISPVEVVIFFAGVIVTVFTTIENGIYVTVTLSAGVMLFRIAKARGHLLGKVEVRSVTGNNLYTVDDKNSARDSEVALYNAPADLAKGGSGKKSLGRSLEDNSARNVYLPLDQKDGSNPGLKVVSPYPGIFIYRFSEGFLYANASHYTENLVQQITFATRPNLSNTTTDVGDRAWNDPPPKASSQTTADTRPILRAIILDFASVNNVDITSVQNLIDVRTQLDRYVAPDTVEWHFASIGSRWTKRALTAAGFGFPSDREEGDINNKKKTGWAPVFSVASVEEAVVVDGNGTVKKGFDEEGGRPLNGSRYSEEEEVDEGVGRIGTPVGTGRRRVPVVIGGINRPFFHVDIDGALRSAIASIESR